MLTDRFIRNARPGMYADEAGLYLRVHPSGKKVFVRRTREGGRDRWKNLGYYPSMSLAAARGLILTGDTQPRLSLTEAKMLYTKRIAVRRPEQIEWLLKNFPSMTADRAELMELLQHKATNAPVMANRMLTRWKDFLNFCCQQGWIATNPLEGVQRRFVGGKERSRSRVLTWDEISALRDPMLLFILLTGLRPTEAIWVIRNSRITKIPTKTTPHQLPDTHLIRWALRQPIEVPSSHLTLSNRLRRAGADYRPHDLRRTFATRMADLGTPPHIIEKLLNHKLQGVMAVYNHAEYWPERIASQRKWERALLALRRKKTPD